MSSSSVKKEAASAKKAAGGGGKPNASAGKGGGIKGFLVPTAQAKKSGKPGPAMDDPIELDSDSEYSG